jgi:predicted secreted protein
VERGGARVGVEKSAPSSSASAWRKVILWCVLQALVIGIWLLVALAKSINGLCRYLNLML